MLDRARAAFAIVGEAIEGVHLKDGINTVMAIAAEFNRYLERKKPWETGKTDRERTRTTLCVALQGLNALRVLTAPFIPFSAQQVHLLLGYEGGDPNGANGGVADAPVGIHDACRRASTAETETALQETGRYPVGRRNRAPSPNLWL